MDNQLPFDDLLPNTTDIDRLFEQVVANLGEVDLTKYSLFSDEEIIKVQDFIIAPIIYLARYGQHPTLKSIAEAGYESIRGNLSGVTLGVVPAPLYISDYLQRSTISADKISQVTRNSQLASKFLSLCSAYSNAQTFMASEIASNTLIQFESDLVAKYPELGRPRIVTKKLEMNIFFTPHYVNVAKEDPKEAMFRIIYACSRGRDFANGRHNFEDEGILNTRAVVAHAQFLYELRSAYPDIPLNEYEVALVRDYPYGFDTLDLPLGINY